MRTPRSEGSEPAHEYLTIAQAAQVLQLAPVTVYRWAKKGKIPGAIKLGGQWRISAAVLAAAFQTPTLAPDAVEAILQALPVVNGHA
jgi:excisionase family DNA binding protein